jgi:hypothetical protein
MIKRILIITLSLTTTIFPVFNANITPITPNIKNRMIKGHSWRRGCPVSLIELRYIEIKYHDFNGVDRVGELIVHRDIANDVVWIMEELYNINYPIKQMRLISDFNGNDWKSIEADNTSAFNCRRATGSKKWSKHAYGMAIDINPIENPYISRRGRISHKKSLKYRRRVDSNRAVLLKDSQATIIFKSYGFGWGGDWRYTKDYQHFSKK